MKFDQIAVAFVYGSPCSLTEWTSMRDEFPSLYEVRFITNHRGRKVYSEFMELNDILRKQGIDTHFVGDILTDEPHSALFTWEAPSNGDSVISRAQDAGMTIVPFGPLAWG